MVVVDGKLIIRVQARGQVIGTSPALERSGLPCRIITTVSQRQRFVIDIVFVYSIQVLLAKLIDGAQADVGINVPALHRMEYQLALHVHVVIFGNGTASIGQLCQLTVTHVVSVGILERHRRPHTHDVVIEQTTQVGIERVVQVGMHVLHVHFHIQPLEGLCVQFGVRADAFVRIVAEAQVTVLTQVIGRHVVLHLLRTSVDVQVVLMRPRPFVLLVIPVHVVIGFLVELPVAVRIGHGSRCNLPVHVLLDAVHRIVVEDDVTATVDTTLVEVVGKLVGVHQVGQ